MFSYIRLFLICRTDRKENMQLVINNTIETAVNSSISVFLSSLRDFKEVNTT
jgi:hypothetical protein